MNFARLYVDFNEMLEDDLVLLSQTDVKADSQGNRVQLVEGLRVSVYMDDMDEHGKVDNLLAEGVVVRNVAAGWSSVARWCCRLDGGSMRHESEDAEASQARAGRGR